MLQLMVKVRLGTLPFPVTYLIVPTQVEMLIFDRFISLGVDTNHPRGEFVTREPAPGRRVAQANINIMPDTDEDR